jgi:hypothetical protein
MTTKKARSVKKKYVPASELTFLERKILTQWSEEGSVSLDLLEGCAKKFEDDWGMAWPLTCEFAAQDVVVAKIVSHGNDLDVLSVWHGGMCSRGIYFYLADVEFLDRQILYYYDSAIECSCASRLSVFTTDAIGVEIRRILGERYAYDSVSPGDYSKSVLFSRQQIDQWREEIFGEGEAEEDEEDEEAV